MDNLCKVKDCNNITHIRGYCRTHYKRLMRHGNTDCLRVKKYEGSCSVEGCNKKHAAKGYCNTHYNYWIRHGYPTPKGKQREKHSMSHTPEYTTWDSMIQRCTNSNSHYYKNYGGRGITVCDRWKNSFSAFYEDMGPRPFPKAQIDRIDNNGNYKPKNCRWVSNAINNQNKPATLLTEYKVKAIRKEIKSSTYNKLAKKYNVSRTCIYNVINRKRWGNVI